MPFNLGPVELLLILVIVAMLFGVGKLPEVFGAVGKGSANFAKRRGWKATRKLRRQNRASSRVYPAIPLLRRRNCFVTEHRLTSDAVR